jgi:hypothetical protein
MEPKPGHGLVVAGYVMAKFGVADTMGSHLIVFLRDASGKEMHYAPVDFAPRQIPQHRRPSIRLHIVSRKLTLTRCQSQRRDRSHPVLPHSVRNETLHLVASRAARALPSWLASLTLGKTHDAA